MAIHASNISSLSASAITPFVVIDVETTGFGDSHRIVEVSAVTLDPETLETVEEYDTLVNPERDIPEVVTQVHGLTSSILEAAPTFKEIAPALTRRMNSAFLVAHNQSFDMRFLSNEFKRIGARFNPGSPICTRKLTGKSLANACEEYGVALVDAHRSLVDVRATAEVLRRVMRRDPKARALPEGHTVARCSVPTNDVVIRTLRRENTELKANLPRVAKSPWQDPLRDYRYAVNLALDDGEITDDEWHELETLRTTLGLTKSEAEKQHTILFERTHEAVQRDGYVSPAEERMLLKMATNLGLPYDPPPSNKGEVTVFSGMVVCLTGSGQGMLERTTMIELVEAQGMVVKGGVSRKVDLLVAADVASRSGKTQKARELGKPVMSAREFLQLIGQH